MAKKKRNLKVCANCVNTKTRWCWTVKIFLLITVVFLLFPRPTMLVLQCVYKLDTVS